MKVAKRLLYFRHALKSGQHISDAGREASHNIQLPEDITDAFYGPMERTKETLDALIEGNGILPAVHPPIDEIGRQELEKEIGTKEFVAAVNSGLSNIQAVDRVFSPHQIAAWEEEFGRGITKMFDVMIGTVGVAVGHDPFISLAVRYFGCSDARSIRELEFIQFNLLEDGSITVNF